MSVGRGIGEYRSQGGTSTIHSNTYHGYCNSDLLRSIMVDDGMGEATYNVEFYTSDAKP